QQPVLHCAVLRAGRRSGRQASQADAYRHRTADLGQR
nr:hypothetical protein [Tanacetum cinerariifolium]